MKALKIENSTLSGSVKADLNWFEVIPEPVLKITKSKEKSKTLYEANSSFWTWANIKEIPDVWSLASWEPSSKSLLEFDHITKLDLKKIDESGTYEDILIEIKPGFPRVVEVRVKMIKDVRYLFFRDVTEKRSLQAELVLRLSDLSQAYLELEKKNNEIQSIQECLVQAGKLAALGELAAGIAHEMNQPLLGIKGYSQELKSILKIDASDSIPVLDKVSFGQVCWSLKEVISNVDRMSAIISQMRSYVRKSTESFEWVDIQEVVSEAVKLLAGQLKSAGIRIIDLSKSNKIFANRVQLEQVVINLLSNARDAIAESKRADGKIQINSLKIQNQVELSIEDNGAGMDAKTKAKAFNPFFTTKEVGKGTGLGLSLSHGIISKFNGSIRLETEPGRGSKFTIVLPENFKEQN